MEEQKRTEEQKIFKDAISIVLGGREYQVRPLVIKESRQWRAKVAKVIGDLPQYAKVTTDTPDKFGEAINALFLAVPDKVVELVLEYSSKLKADREFIENNATDSEVSEAFKQMVRITFPLTRSLTEVMGNLAR